MTSKSDATTKSPSNAKDLGKAIINKLAALTKEKTPNSKLFFDFLKDLLHPTVDCPLTLAPVGSSAASCLVDETKFS